MACASNEKRAQQHHVCREALVSHICDAPRLACNYKVPNKLTNSDDRLGINIDPEAVRLQPAPEDGYARSVTDSKGT
jgi:hypothetical protein